MGLFDISRNGSELKALTARTRIALLLAQKASLRPDCFIQKRMKKKSLCERVLLKMGTRPEEANQSALLRNGVAAGEKRIWGG